MKILRHETLEYTEQMKIQNNAIIQKEDESKIIPKHTNAVSPC